MNVLTNKSFIDNIDCIVSLLFVLKQNKFEFDNVSLFNYIKLDIKEELDVEHCISLISNFFNKNCLNNSKLTYVYKNILNNIYVLLNEVDVNILSYYYMHNYNTLNKIIKNK